MGSQGLPRRLLGDPWGGSRAPFGGPWGASGRPWGDRGAPSEATFGKQAALQNHWFYCIKWYILALRGVAGGPWVGQGRRDEGPKPTNRTRRTMRDGLGRPEGTQGRDKGHKRAPQKPTSGNGRSLTNQLLGWHAPGGAPLDMMSPGDLNTPRAIGQANFRGGD